MFYFLSATATLVMAQNTTTERFLIGNSKWRPTWDTPFTMEQMRRQGAAPDNPLMISTSSPWVEIDI
jgi:hypothetical protein